MAEATGVILTEESPRTVMVEVLRTTARSQDMDMATTHPSRIEELLDKEGAKLRTYIRCLVSNTHLADDALQETFIRINRHAWRLWRAEVSRSYLFRIARNEAFRALRRQRSFDSRHTELHDDAMFVPAPDARAVGRRIEQLADAVRQLPDDQREVVLLKNIDGFSFREIGRILRVSPNTAASRYRYGLAKLRQLMSREDSP